MTPTDPPTSSGPADTQYTFNVDAVVNAYLEQAQLILDRRKRDGRAVLTFLAEQAQQAAADLAAGDQAGARLRQRAVKRYLNGVRAVWRIEVARAHNRALKKILTLGFDALLAALGL